MMNFLSYTDLQITKSFIELMGAYMILFNPYNQTITSTQLNEIFDMKLKMALTKITIQT